MRKENVISILKKERYLFEAKEDNIVIQLAKRYFLKLDFENDSIVKIEDRIKFGLLSKGRSLKASTKISMASISIFCVLSIATLYIFTPDFLPEAWPLIIIFTYLMLHPLLEYLYYSRRLLKIKKMLNINL